MIRSYSFVFLLFVSLSLSCVSTLAQSTNNPFGSQRDQDGRKEDLPTGIKENLARNRIKQQEKEFTELLHRAEEAAKIATEINDSFEQNRTLKSSDQKKLQRIEKLVKKIREDLGGSDDGEEEFKKLPIETALKGLQEKTSAILFEIKDSGRYAVSLAAIEGSNFVLRTIRFLRFAP